MAITLRQIVEMVGPEFLDVPLSICVRDGNRNTEWIAPLDAIGTMSRDLPREKEGYPGRMSLTAYLQEHRLVKARR